jgi:hypothetical protein
MADTTYYDLPYPASTDKVSLGYQNMQDLAEQIDTILNDANVPIVGDGANVLRTDTVFGGILAGTYDALTLDDDAVTTVKILDDAVTEAKIGSAAVTSGKIGSSVALAGSPTTTTQAQSDGSTKIATTAYVDSYITGTVPDDSLTNVKINSAAAIAYSKLNLASSITSADIVDGTIVNADINASAAIDKTKVSGTAVTVADTGTVTSTMLLDGTILNADVNSSAAITYSKLDLATSIVNADVNASAAIAYSKLDLNGAILNADLAGSIAYSKLSLATSIVNADIAAAAGIVDTKLATISTALKVSNSATTATDANTASAIVARDASGNFTAGMITANLTGTVTGSIGLGFPITKTADFTVGASENWLITNKGSSCVVTLPSAATNRTIWIKNIAAFTVVSASSNVKPIGTDTAGTAILPATAGTWCTLVSDGTDWIVMQSGPGLFS